jgi:hypothetical protein
MKHEFKTLSRSLLVARNEASPVEVLNTILLEVIQHLGPAAVGHAKAVARVEGGIVHASTTGTPLAVEAKIVGTPAVTVDRLQVDALCVFYGVKWRTLEMAWQGALDALTQGGFQVTVLPVTQRPGEQRRALPQARIGIFASLLPSFLVIKPCCLLPTLGSLFGGSVGVLHVFAPLEPYQPLFMLTSLGLLGSAFHHLYLRPPTFNAKDQRDSILTSRLLFWLASGVFIAAALYPRLALSK